MSGTFRIAYTQRRTGARVYKVFSVAQATERLAYLDADEALTRKVAPTNSGDTRFDYAAEATALREALEKLAAATTIARAIFQRANEPASDLEVQLLAEDLVGLSADNFAIGWCDAEMMRRIGGETNLRSYVDCLLAAENILLRSRIVVEDLESGSVLATPYSEPARDWMREYLPPNTPQQSRGYVVPGRGALACFPGLIRERA